jgi:hypothetical protein
MKVKDYVLFRIFPVQPASNIIFISTTARKTGSLYAPLIFTVIFTCKSIDVFKGLPSEWERLLDKSGISKDEVKANPQVVIDVLRFYTSMLTSSNAIQDMQVTLIPQQQHLQGSQQTEQTANKRKDSQQQQQQQQQQPTPKPFPRSSSLDKLANTVTAVSAPVVIQDISSPSNVQHHIHISHSSATGYSVSIFIIWT